MKTEKDVHTEHCCILHGCKYGEDDDCPVTTRNKLQSHLCEICKEYSINSIGQFKMIETRVKCTICDDTGFAPHMDGEIRTFLPCHECKNKKKKVIKPCKETPKFSIPPHQYINHAVQSKCFPDLLMMGMFPNAKEITESWAMFAATHHLPPGYEWNDAGVKCFVVGDGKKPRTGAMFAFRTKWQVYSIDPILVNQKFNVERLTLHRGKVETFNYDGSDNKYVKVLIVMPHSHAPVQACLNNILGINRALITMDCCVNQKVDKQPDIEYEDKEVWSPKRTVKVWKSI